MALNQEFDHGDSVELPVPADTPSGTAVIVGALCGTTRNAEGTQGSRQNHATVDLVGCYRQTVAGALTPGVPVYLTSGGSLTATSTGNTLWGHSLSVKASGSGLAVVRPARV